MQLVREKNEASRKEDEDGAGWFHRPEEMKWDTRSEKGVKKKKNVPSSGSR